MATCFEGTELYCCSDGRKRLNAISDVVASCSDVVECSGKRVLRCCCLSVGDLAKYGVEKL